MKPCCDVHQEAPGAGPVEWGAQQSGIWMLGGAPPWGGDTGAETWMRWGCEPRGDLEEEDSGQKERKAERFWGRDELGRFEEQQEGQCAWSRVVKQRVERKSDTGKGGWGRLRPRGGGWSWIYGRSALKCPLTSEASPGHCRCSLHSTLDPLSAIYVAICLAPVFVMRTWGYTHNLFRSLSEHPEKQRIAAAQGVFAEWMQEGQERTGGQRHSLPAWAPPSSTAVMGY